MRRRPLCLLCLILCAVLTLLYAMGVPLTAEPSDMARAEQILSESSVRREVTGVAVKSETQDGYCTLILKQSYLHWKSETYSIGRVKITYKDGGHIQAGVRVCARGMLTEIEGPRNPGGFDAALYWRLQGIRFAMSGASVAVTGGSANVPAEMLICLRRNLSGHIQALWPEDVADILCAMLTGDRSGLDERVRALWRTAGVTHMLCISGLHLTVLGMGLFELLRKMKIRTAPAGILSLLVMAGYTVFTGASVSACRAFFMFALGIIAKLIGRTYDFWTALAVAAMLILLENPYYLFYSGFQMSFAAVMICGIFRKRSKGMVALMLYLWMLPLVLMICYEIPVYSIAVNLIAVPLLPAILGTGILGTAGAYLPGVYAGSAAGSAGFFPALARALALPATALVRVLNFLLGRAGALPYASFICGRPEVWRVALYVSALLIWCVLAKAWRTERRRICLLVLVPALVALLAVRVPSHLFVSFIDVGQGDGIAIETPCGINCLIDSGSSTVMNVGQYRVLPYLKYRGIRRLDYIFVTHTDSDHTSGIEELLAMTASGQTSLRVGTVVMPYMAKRDEAYRRMEQLAGEAGARFLAVSEGDAFAFGGVRLSVLNPDPGRETGDADANGQCIVLALSYGDFDALFAGDVSGDGERNVISELRNEERTFDVLKVAHHGSKYSTPPELLELIRPSVSIISAGSGNRYGHPSRETLGRLRACGTDIYDTISCGRILVETDGTSFRVERWLGEN
ncbi:MAG: DNA internalization-related competence protein ComEC/Rec2 [Eubacteriales bacterium]|jgi:competence protein ComEC